MNKKLQQEIQQDKDNEYRSIRFWLWMAPYTKRVGRQFRNSFQVFQLEQIATPRPKYANKMLTTSPETTSDNVWM